ncbi:MAG TPA: VOC family protein [Tepidiformaceae bacterium]|nr:VOC family protein [Tepidiformaceae bacterium]
MLSYVDRVQIVVPDRREAVQTWKELFGAEQVGESESKVLGARITTVQAGRSEFEFLEPMGEGPVGQWAASWRTGLYGAGFSTPSLFDMERHLGSKDVPYEREGDRIYISGEATDGMPTTITQDVERSPVGHISFLYEVTNPVADWQETAAKYTRIFGLDPTRYHPIKSGLYGYEGTLTLFNPPDRLDRVEITQTWGDKAMDRFYKRRGPSLYMCYIETEDVAGLAERLNARGDRFTMSEDRPAETGLFIHPSALFGMLMGVSATNYAWVWSGRPELAGEGAAASYRAH